MAATTYDKKDAQSLSAAFAVLESLPHSAFA